MPVIHFIKGNRIKISKLMFKITLNNSRSLKGKKKNLRKSDMSTLLWKNSDYI